MELVARKKSFDAFSDESFHTKRQAFMKNQEAFNRDVQYAMRVLQDFYSRIFNSEEFDGDINISKEIKLVNKMYFFLRTEAHFSKLVSEGKNKGFFKTMMGMDKDKITADFRLFIFYILSMSCWMNQRMHFARKYCEEKGIEQKDRYLPNPHIPGEVFFKDYGQQYWSIVAVEAINQTNREILIMRNRVENMLEKKNITAYINEDGEPYYALNKSVEIKLHQAQSATEKLRNRRVV